ncbi:MAG: hypothetical protein IID09_09230 [Candidatus Hydrogenedentes bacterium]|nr:hypothetical protein [Candidatus Hydrogenedentota bacterium]
MFRFGGREQEELPDERRVASVRALTPSGWIQGNLFVPGLVRLVDFIDKEEMLRLTEAQVEGDTQGREFLTLRRDSIILLMVEGNENLESAETVGHQDEHLVSCWIDCGAVQGTLLLRLGTRLSDFLARHDGLVVLRECRYRIRNPLTMKVEDGQSSAVLLNPRSIVAATDRSQPGEE